LLAKWDKQVTIGSVAPSIFFTWVRRLAEDVLKRRLDADLATALASRDRHVTRVLELLLQQGESSFIRDLPVRELVSAAFDEALCWLRERFGDDPGQWQWGRVHTLLIPNLLKPAEPLGPFPRDGGPNCIDVASFGLTGEGFVTRGGATMRMVVELSQPPQSTNVVAGRQGIGDNIPSSGKDQLPLWREHRHRPMRF